jgi:hypothetical protein
LLLGDVLARACVRVVELEGLQLAKLRVIQRPKEKCAVCRQGREFVIAHHKLYKMTLDAAKTHECHALQLDTLEHAPSPNDIKDQNKAIRAPLFEILLDFKVQTNASSAKASAMDFCTEVSDTAPATTALFLPAKLKEGDVDPCDDEVPFDYLSQVVCNLRMPCICCVVDTI